MLQCRECFALGSDLNLSCNAEKDFALGSELNLCCNAEKYFALGCDLNLCCNAEKDFGLSSELNLCCNAEKYFGLGSEGGSALLADDVGVPLQPPALAASTMLLALSHFTLCLVRSEEHLGEAKRMFKSALRLGLDTAVLTKQFARADDLFARDKQWFGETIKTIAFGLIC